MSKQGAPIGNTYALKHGDDRGGGSKRTPEYTAWRNMITRCENPNSTRYKEWGGRGITVCRRWRRSYIAFLTDMGRRPSSSHSLDRKKNSQGYTPSNCRWATREEQALNQRGVISPRKIAAIKRMLALGVPHLHIARKLGIGCPLPHRAFDL